MKTRFTQKFLMAFLMLGLFTTSQAQTYVNGGATGANDGSSWADAYTDLTAALGTATGDLWIAAGTYNPAGADATFEVTSPLNIYGGFAGTEASLADRVDGNTTILSGDLAGDDMDNVFNANKTDNVAHVMSIDVGASDKVILDGLEISGGFGSDDDTPTDTYLYSGAGVYTSSTVEVNNCNFNNNTCANGAGLFMIGDSDDSKINNCTFEKSLVSERAAGAMSNSIDGFTVTNSTFRDNVTGRGALYAVRGNDLMIDNCTFTNNSNQAGFAAGMMIWNSVGGTVQNSTFTGNIAANSSAIYCDGRELPAGQNHMTFDNLTFTDNVANSSQGGGIQTFNSSHTMSNCTFTNNSAPSFGGGHIDNGENQMVISNNNKFKNNSSAQVGGGHAFNGGSTTYMVTGNTYDSNVSTQWGGAVFTGFGAKSIFTDCYFEDNESETGPAGAIWAQNDTTELTIERSQFIDNTSGGSSGAVGLSGPIPTSISNSFFRGNFAVGFGGALNGDEGSTDPGEAKVTITNSIFRENFTDAQGAGLSLVDFDVDIINSEFSANINQGEGAGGAMSLNSTDTSTVEVNIIHSTIVSNFGVIGAGIAAFTGETDSKLSINLTNTVLSNVDGNNYEVEGGTPKFTSNGGNVSADETTSDVFSNTNDMNGVDSDELFEEADEFNFIPSSGSVLIDNGVEAGLSTDIYSNEREGAAPETGAYEVVLVSTEEVLENNGQLTMTPNPAATVATITVDNAWNGAVNITVSDMTGKVVSNQYMNKSAQKQNFNLNVSEMSEGNYILTLRAEDAVVSTQFIKI
jgi:hypothetical protein